MADTHVLDWGNSCGGRPERFRSLCGQYLPWAQHYKEPSCDVCRALKAEQDAVDDSLDEQFAAMATDPRR